MRIRSSDAARWTWFSPWMIIGSVCLLAGILLVLAVKNIHREKDFMVRALLSQANVLMRSIEAGSRTGMMGMGWGRRQVQLLLEETSQQSDVVYLALVTPTGQIVAHSAPEKIGEIIPLTFPKPGETSYRFSQKGSESFEVMRSYQPWFRQRGGGSMDVCPNWGGMEEPPRELFIIAGLDPKPFEEARDQDVQHTVLLFGVMFLVGAGGFVSLIWAQNYRSAKCSLQDIRAFTSTVVNQMPIGLIATDADGRIQSANGAARAILNHPEVISGRIDDFPCFLPLVQRLKKEESVIEQEIRCRTWSAGRVPLLVNAAVIRDGENRTAGYAYLFADVTNIKQLEEQLRRSERLASLGKLAAGVAHEIRNPLSSIKGFATLLAGRSKGDERSQKLAEVMVQEVERLNRVVSELLDFARPTELNKRAYGCKELVEKSLHLIEGDAAHKGVKLEAHIDPEDLRVEVDPDRFTQVLLNLYLNALQAMEAAGTIRVEALRKGDWTLFSVVDSGKGIAPEDLPHIFDPYFTTKPSGVGLGLANVHKFIEAHGGEIEAQSSPGEGACFTIRLPSLEEHSSSAVSAIFRNTGETRNGDAFVAHSR